MTRRKAESKTTYQDLLARPQERKPFQPFGAALTAWRSRRRELVLAGPANTGKSRSILEKLHYCADRYPGMRGLIVRKSRASITQTAMVTFEKKVIPDGWLEDNLVHFNVSDQQYEYPNGSIIAVGGLDKSSKIMSSEWDMIYPQEATELTLGDWEDLSSRLRNHKMPYQQLIGDCNPSVPTHWLKVRSMSGKLLMLESRHEDNPACTPEDIATLDALTGVRYLRLRLGLWAAAEGLVYEEWDPAKHVLSQAQLIEQGVFHPDGTVNRDKIAMCVGGVDWGWTNPGVLQVYGVDHDSRLYLLAEMYKTQQTDDWWVRQALSLQTEFHVEKWYADPSEPNYIAKFNQAGLPTVKGNNAIKPGISAMQTLLQTAGDGRPRFHVYQEALRDRDDKRVKVSQPFCLEGEIGEYVWPKSKDGSAVKEVPVKVNDHACDAARYVCMALANPKVPLAGDDEGTVWSGEAPTSQPRQETLTLVNPATIDPFEWAAKHGYWWDD